VALHQGVRPPADLILAGNPTPSGRVERAFRRPPEDPMHVIPRQSLSLIVAMLLSACTGGAPSPSPQPSPPSEAGFLLRATIVQAVPPGATFVSLPSALITLDGRALAGSAVPAIFPGPLLQPVNQRQLTPAGWSRIVAAARDAGLLSGRRDFTGGAAAPGSALGRLQVVADGQLFDLTGDPARTIVCVTAPCTAPAGTAEAFAMFWSSLGDLTWLGSDVGPDQPYAPEGYAILVGPPPAADPNLPQPAIAWPLAAGFAAFGRPTSDGTGGRCGTVSGADAVALRPALQAANQLTPWRDPADGSLHGLVVRPLLPGDEEACAGLV